MSERPSVEAIVGYLHERNWHEVAGASPHFTAWRTQRNKAARVLVPDSDEWPDYSRRVDEILNVLASIEQRDPRAIEQDMTTTGWAVQVRMLQSLMRELKRPGTFEFTCTFSSPIASPDAREVWSTLFMATVLPPHSPPMPAMEALRRGFFGYAIPDGEPGDKRTINWDRACANAVGCTRLAQTFCRIVGYEGSITLAYAWHDTASVRLSRGDHDDAPIDTTADVGEVRVTLGPNPPSSFEDAQNQAYMPLAYLLSRLRLPPETMQTLLARYSERFSTR